MSQRSTHGGRPSPALHKTGPIAFLNPTVAYHGAYPASPQDAGAKTDVRGTEPDASGRRPPGIARVWRSRDNRKGRHAVALAGDSAGGSAGGLPPHTNTLSQTLRGIWKMFVRYPVWDVSYDVATVFTLGSVVWVFNGFFVWLPLQIPSSEFAGEVDMGGGVTAFVGATIFEIGSVLLMLEAVNENRADCFGWALEEAAESRSLILRPDENGCSHHHRVRKALFATRKLGGKADRTWQWWPTWHELTTHYLREIGFLACLAQFMAASVFWISGLTGLPPILDALSTPVENVIFWLPQVLGGFGFIVSSALFMLEVQSKWYLPAPKILGWHIGFWNLIGSLGFFLCGALGFASDNTAAAYASTLATFIGSWGFLVGSVIQWFESLDKYPISVDEEASQTVDKKSNI